VRWERTLEVYRAFLLLAFILICPDRILKWPAVLVLFFPFDSLLMPYFQKRSSFTFQPLGIRRSFTSSIMPGCPQA